MRITLRRAAAALANSHLSSDATVIGSPDLAETETVLALAFPVEPSPEIGQMHGEAELEYRPWTEVV